MSLAARRSWFPARVGRGCARRVRGPRGRRCRLPSRAAATCRVSEAARAASAAAAELVPASDRICAVASAAARPAWTHRASRSAAVSPLPGACLAGSHRWVSFGQVRSGASLPPEYQTGLPSLPVSPDRATAYPVTWPGARVLYRCRVMIPARSRRAKNSASLADAAAATVTARRRVTRSGSPSPRRAAFSVSARVE
jgi:hypothetical protein